MEREFVFMFLAISFSSFLSSLSTLHSACQFVPSSSLYLRELLHWWTDRHLPVITDILGSAFGKAPRWLHNPCGAVFQPPQLISKGRAGPRGLRLEAALPLATKKAKSTWLLEVIIPYDKLKPGPTINKNIVSSTAQWNLAHVQVKNVETISWEKC